MSASVWSASDSDILDEVREAYLTRYSNADRLGCPSAQLVKDLAAGRFRPAPDSDMLQHLTRCSDCYKEFRSERATRSHEKSNARRLLALAFVVFASGILALRFGTKS